jgi:hypothetical protein
VQRVLHRLDGGELDIVLFAVHGLALFGGLFQRAYGLDRANLEKIFPGVAPRDLAIV